MCKVIKTMKVIYSLVNYECGNITAFCSHVSSETQCKRAPKKPFALVLRAVMSHGEFKFSVKYKNFGISLTVRGSRGHKGT